MNWIWWGNRRFFGISVFFSMFPDNVFLLFAANLEQEKNFPRIIEKNNFFFVVVVVGRITLIINIWILWMIDIDLSSKSSCCQHPERKIYCYHNAVVIHGDDNNNGGSLDFGQKTNSSIVLVSSWVQHFKNNTIQKNGPASAINVFFFQVVCGGTTTLTYR